MPGGLQQGELQQGELPEGGMPDGAGRGLTSGTVTSIDGGTITLELEDGTTVTITTGDDTTVTSTQESSVDKLAEGDTISVVGEADDDGNVTATRITEGDTAFGAFPGGAVPAQ